MVQLLRCGIWSLVVLSVGAALPSAKAGQIPVFLDGPGQQFSAVMSLYGSFGSPLLMPPTVPLPPDSIVINGNPKVIGANPNGGVGTLFNISGSQLNDIQNLHISFLSEPAPVSPPTLLTVPTPGDALFFKKLKVNLTEVVTDLEFHQTGAAHITSNGNGSGSYAVDGQFALTVGARQVSFIGQDAYVLPGTTLTLDGQLTGNYFIGGTEEQPLISMTGSMLLSFPHHYVTGDPPVSLISTLNVAGGYHLQWGTHPIPEPGSLALLALGLIGLVPAAVSVRRRSRGQRDRAAH